MSRSTRLNTAPLALGTFTVAVVLGIAGFSAAAAGDDWHGNAGYEPGVSPPFKSYGKAYAYKPGGKKYVHKRYAHKKQTATLYGSAKNGGAYHYKPSGYDDHGYKKAHGTYRVNAPVARYGWAPVYRSGYRYNPNHCHRVSKDGYTRNGRKVKFGGTMCYDKHGRGFILNGSRHIIRYY